MRFCWLTSSIFCFSLVFSPVAMSQEFEITLPEDLDGLKPVRALEQRSAKDDRPAKGSAVKTVSDAELFLFRHTYESMSMLERIAKLETTLYGQSKSGDLKQRLHGIALTINGGKVIIAPQKIGSVDVAQKMSNKKLKKKRWWRRSSPLSNQVSSKPDSKETALLKAGRRYYSQSKWQKAYDQFAQVLMLDANHLESLYKKAACQMRIYSNPPVDIPAGVVDSKLVSARESLVQAERLYELARDTQEALLIKKLIDEIDLVRQKQSTATGGEDF